MFQRVDLKRPKGKETVFLAKKGKTFVTPENREYVFDYKKEGNKYTILLTYKGQRYQMSEKDFFAFTTDKLLKKMEEGQMNEGVENSSNKQLQNEVASDIKKFFDTKKRNVLLTWQDKVNYINKLGKEHGVEMLSSDNPVVFKGLFKFLNDQLKNQVLITKEDNITESTNWMMGNKRSNKTFGKNTKTLNFMPDDAVISEGAYEDYKAAHPDLNWEEADNEISDEDLAAAADSYKKSKNKLPAGMNKFSKEIAQKAKKESSTDNSKLRNSQKQAYYNKLKIKNEMNKVKAEKEIVKETLLKLNDKGLLNKYKIRNYLLKENKSDELKEIRTTIETIKNSIDSWMSQPNITDKEISVISMNLKRIQKVVEDAKTFKTQSPPVPLLGRNATPPVNFPKGTWTLSQRVVLSAGAWEIGAGEGRVLRSDGKGTLEIWSDKYQRWKKLSPPISGEDKMQFIYADYPARIQMYNALAIATKP